MWTDMKEGSRTRYPLAPRSHPALCPRPQPDGPEQATVLHVHSPHKRQCWDSHPTSAARQPATNNRKRNEEVWKINKTLHSVGFMMTMSFTAEDLLKSCKIVTLHFECLCSLSCPFSAGNWKYIPMTGYTGCASTGNEVPILKATAT